MPLAFSQPLQFSEALQALEVRSLLPTDLSTAELDRILAEIKERSLFSARVTNIEFLDEVGRVLQAFINGDTDLATARLALKQKLDALDYRPLPGEEGTIKDLSTDGRLNLILDTNADMARGYGQWIQGQDAAILDEGPEDT